MCIVSIFRFYRLILLSSWQFPLSLYAIIKCAHINKKRKTSSIALSTLEQIWDKCECSGGSYQNFISFHHEAIFISIHKI